MNEVVAIQSTAVAHTATAVEIKAQVQLIQQVMTAVMKRDTHYGVIPYTDKPTLYKAGSEVLLSTFRIAVDPDVEDLSTHDEIRFRVKARGVHQSTGVIVGCGIGEASTNEEKYKWRAAVCKEEFDATPEDRRRVKYGKGKGGGHYTAQQIRTNPADLANTVLKMAKKRAQIDLTLTALAASDCFTQDLEDMPEELRGTAAGEDGADHEQQRRPATKAPQSNGGGKTANDGQLTLLKKKLEQKGKTEADLCGEYNLQTIDQLPFDKVNDALSWVQTL